MTISDPERKYSGTTFQLKHWVQKIIKKYYIV